MFGPRSLALYLGRGRVLQSGHVADGHTSLNFNPRGRCAISLNYTVHEEFFARKEGIGFFNRLS